jgi:ABC-type multidrug transport system ATPase subunit
VAAALIGEPAVLVLDEPTNGLDAAGASALTEVLREERERGAAILVATHDRALVDALADTRLHLSAGRLDS